MSISIMFLLCSVPLLAGQRSLVNFKHLEHLIEGIDFLGGKVEIVHIYANYPSYEWVDAKESGPEGIACVDDAARAAVLYVRHYELTKDTSSLMHARGLLSFIKKMQAADGKFYNFIFADHSINREGKTSSKSFGWWASRGVWAMAIGYRVIRNIDPDFAEELRQGIDRSLPFVDSLLVKYKSIRMVGRYEIPQWLLYESGADATSELLLGLVEFYKASGDPKIRGYIFKLAKGLMTMQDGDEARFPFALHRSWHTVWHMWGNGQTQALASAGRILGDSSMVLSAEEEVRGFYSRLLIHGFFKEMDLTAPGNKAEFDQIAYGVRPAAVGLLRVYEATGKKEYLTMAGLVASWLFGNNPPRKIMYDTTTGRCFDGIRDSSTINKNSGAESTIEALFTLLEIDRYPEAKRYLSYRKIAAAKTPLLEYAVFADDRGNEITLVLEPLLKRQQFLEKEESRRFRSRLK